MNTEKKVEKKIYKIIISYKQTKSGQIQRISKNKTIIIRKRMLKIHSLSSYKKSVSKSFFV